MNHKTVILGRVSVNLVRDSGGQFELPIRNHGTLSRFAFARRPSGMVLLDVEFRFTKFAETGLPWHYLETEAPSVNLFIGNALTLTVHNYSGRAWASDIIAIGRDTSTDRLADDVRQIRQSALRCFSRPWLEEP
jgi:hypothetical protein